VWCAARFTNPQRKAELEALGIKTCMWDMDSGDNSSLPDDFTHVVHSALNLRPNYDQAITTNAEGSALLMQHCHKAEAFLHISSTCVYKPHPDHPNHAYAETDPLGGLATYAEVYPVAKMTSESSVRATARMFNLPTTIARMNVGYSWTGHGGLPVMQYNTFKNGQPWLIPIGYNNIGSPISGVDIAAQAHKLLEVATVPARIVNWGGDDPVTDQEMGEFVAELTGVTASFVESPISFDSFWSDNTRREQLIGKCSVHWKDGARNTFERLGIIAGQPLTVRKAEKCERSWRSGKRLMHDGWRCNARFRMTEPIQSE
jgi:nucleoside-diphosphate-sugar epimerase